MFYCFPPTHSQAQPFSVCSDEMVCLVVNVFKTVWSLCSLFKFEQFKRLLHLRIPNETFTAGVKKTYLSKNYAIKAFRDFLRTVSSLPEWLNVMAKIIKHPMKIQ